VKLGCLRQLRLVQANGRTLADFPGLILFRALSFSPAPSAQKIRPAGPELQAYIEKRPSIGFLRFLQAEAARLELRRVPHPFAFFAKGWDTSINSSLSRFYFAVFCAAIHASMRASSTSSGNAPESST
jgi:hypothetical protein